MYYKNRLCSLSKVQNILNKGKFTKLKQVRFMRLFSYEEIINWIRINYISIIVDLKNELLLKIRTISKGPTPSGLFKNIKSHDFFQWVHFMYDTCEVIKNLTLFFERRKVVLSSIEGKVAIAQKSFRKTKKGNLREILQQIRWAIEETWYSSSCWRNFQWRFQKSSNRIYWYSFKIFLIDWKMYE